MLNINPIIEDLENVRKIPSSRIPINITLSQEK